MEVPSGTYGCLTDDAVIAAARTELKLETTDSVINFRRLLNQGVRALDSLSIFKKRQCRVEVVDGVACLPAGLNRVLAVYVGNGCECANAIYVDLPFLRLCGCMTNNQQRNVPLGNTFEIQAGNIIFHSPYFSNTTNNSNTTCTDEDGNTSNSNCDCDDPENGQLIEWCEIAFLGLDVDDNGLMRIYADYERGLVAYLCWNYTRQNFNEYPQYIQESYHAEWIAQKKWLRSIAFQQNQRETQQQIQEWFNAMVVVKNFVL